MSWLRHAITPRTADANRRRQGFLVIIVSTAITLLSLVLGLNSLSTNGVTNISIAILAGTLIYAGCAFAARVGKVRLAAAIITWFPWLIIVAILLQRPSTTTIAFMSIPILLASVVLSSRHVIPVAALGLAIAVFGASRDAAGLDSYVSTIFFLVMISALAYVSAWSVEGALRSTADAHRDLELANTALNETNSALETRVAERTADLQQREQALQQTLSELHETLDQLRSSQETIREMSVPILPLGHGALVMPLVGALDGERLHLALSHALRMVEQTAARYVILDITAVPVVDTHVARGIIAVVQALRLLGAEALIVGIRPEVAQTIVGLGIQLDSVVTHASLQSGIDYVLRRTENPRATHTPR
jgi:rsbT co-antagonist protein RsbR